MDIFSKKIGSSIFLTTLLGLSSTVHADPMSLVGDLLIGAYHSNKVRVDNNTQMNLKKSLFGSDAECLSPVGSVRIHEPENDHWTFYKLPAPTNILQSIITESNCFTVVNRGAGFSALQHERALMGSDSQIANAQIRSADYILVPDIITQNANAGGANVGAAGSQNSGFARVAGSFGLSGKKKTSEVVLSLIDVRTSEQILSIHGEAEITDKDWNLLLSANDAQNAAKVNVGNWSNTEIGKVLKTAYQNTYKKMILEIGKKDLLARYGDQKSYSTLATPNVAAQAVAPVAAQNITVQNVISVSNEMTNNTNTLITESLEHLKQAKTLVLRRNTRMFTNPNMSSDIVGDIQEGMLVYPIGSFEQNMLKVEDEQGRTGWISGALLQSQN